jgi:O-antigen biosynthesis protein
MPTLSVIIVSYNVKYFLEQCLLSVYAASKNINIEIIVVDNNSQDDSVNFVITNFKEVLLIANKENKGFSQANNQGVKIAKGEYILFLNPDTLIAEDCLEKAMEALQNNTQAGALGIYMIDGTGAYLPESKRAYPSPLTSLYKLFGLADLFPKSKKFSRYYLGHLPKNSTNEIEVLSGAFIMLPTAIAKQIKGFDEQFFMYGEDIDLSYRINKLGYKNLYFADSHIIHFKGESTQKNNIRYIKIFYKAMDQFVAKHYSNATNKIMHLFLQVGIGFRSTIALLINFFKKSLPIFFDLGCLLISYFITSTINGLVFMRQNLTLMQLLPFLACFFCIYLLGNITTNKYFGSNKFGRLICWTIVSTAASYLTSFYFFDTINISWAFLFCLLFLMARYGLSLKLMQNEWLLPYSHLPKHEQMIIISNYDSYNKINTILQKNKLDHTLIGRVHTDNNLDCSVGGIKDLPIIIKNYPIKEIVFAITNEFSYKETIALLEQLPNKIKFYYYNEKANAIISSFSKNSSGNVLH